MNMNDCRLFRGRILAGGPSQNYPQSFTYSGTASVSNNVEEETIQTGLYKHVMLDLILQY